ncbi:alpha/beta-hydrolase [Bimuria novae-zelandiae CBS 107.79]|uniref:Alpha/beta-hydrolase n=1 Tax=Bimuria novae-zelandiae CBS 107.79 TaxID=1447943 RepID=A0A6A5VX70_9PLEO|nr:alpha/beta-hydrolase [Bimuria novae-zelandiae CBS 107.79]
MSSSSRHQTMLRWSTSSFERASLARLAWFDSTQYAYGQVQKTKPRTLAYALHDSPLGMLAWIADKLLLWSDTYPWTHDELITFTLLHYFPGPDTAFQMYRKNLPGSKEFAVQPGVERYVRVPTGVSAFGGEMYMVPRAWAEREMNVVEWVEHETGGHFPAYEWRGELSGDIIAFVEKYWEG